MKTIVNCETGEIIERELNKAEKDQQKIDEATSAELAVLVEAELAEKNAAKVDILKKLGITAEEARLLLS